MGVDEEQSHVYTIGLVLTVELLLTGNLVHLLWGTAQLCKWASYRILLMLKLPFFCNIPLGSY